MLHDIKKAKSTAAMVKDEAQLAVFRVGGEEYGVDIMRIMEIIRPLKVTKVPKAPSFMEGIINLRGKVVPVLEMRHRLGVSGQRADDKKARTIILKTEGGILGVMVDEVTEVVYVRRDQIEETPEPVKGPDAQYLHGVAKLGERLILLLDVPRLLTRDEIEELKAAKELVPEG